jgi:excisionase family DNA binding protein
MASKAIPVSLKYRFYLLTFVVFIPIFARMKHSETFLASSHLSLRPDPRSTSATEDSSISPLDIGLPRQRLLLKVGETADLLHISLTTVRNLIDSGVLEAGNIGKPTGCRQHVRITRESVERFRRQRFGR